MEGKSVKAKMFSAILMFLAYLGVIDAAARGEEPKVVSTAKERLSSKAADQQRVNDCKVPASSRGDRRRPAECTGTK